MATMEKALAAAAKAAQEAAKQEKLAALVQQAKAAEAFAFATGQAVAA